MEEVFQFYCPYCGELNDSFFDLSQGSTDYIEDCQVCCRPINLCFDVRADGSFSVEPKR